MDRGATPRSDRITRRTERLLDINIQLDAGEISSGTEGAIRDLERLRKAVQGIESVAGRLQGAQRGELDAYMAKARQAVNSVESDAKKLARTLTTIDPKDLRQRLTEMNSSMGGLLKLVDELRRKQWTGPGAEEAVGKIRMLAAQVGATVETFGKLAMSGASASRVTGEAASAAAQRASASAKSMETVVDGVDRKLTQLSTRSAAAARQAAVDLATIGGKVQAATAAVTTAASASSSSGRLFTSSQIAAGQWRFNQALEAGKLRPEIPGPSTTLFNAAQIKEQNAALNEASKAAGAAAKAASALGAAQGKAAEGGAALGAGMKENILNANNMHSAYRGLASGFGTMWLTYGRVLPLLAGAGISNSIVQAVRSGAELDHTLKSIGAMGEMAAGDVEKLNKVLLETGRTSTYGPLEAAEALKALAYAGLTVTQQLQALPTVLDFSKVGGQSLKDSAETLTAVGTAYGYQADEFSLVADTIAKAAATSMADVSDMSQAFRQASVVAQQYGVSLRDTATGLALLSQAGIRGSAAGTAFRQMYNELIGSSKKARAAMEELGVSIFDNVNNKMRPLEDIVTDLSKAMNGMNFEQITRTLQTIGNERGLKSLSAVMQAIAVDAHKMGEDVPNSFKRIADEIANSAGFAARAAQEMSTSTESLMKGVSASIQTTLADAFQKAQPEVNAFLISLRAAFNDPGVAEGIASLIRGAISLAGAVVGLVSAFSPYLDIAIKATAVMGGLYLLYQTQLGVMASWAAAKALMTSATVASTTAVVASNAAMTATVPAATAAAGAMAVLRGAMLPLLGVIGAVYGAYLALKSLMGSNATDKAVATIEEEKKRLSAERDRMLAENEQLRKGKSAEQAEALTRQGKMLAELEATKGAEIAAQTKTLENLREQQDKATTAVRKQQLQRQIDAAEGRSKQLRKDIENERQSLADLNNDTDMARQANARAKEAQFASRYGQYRSQFADPNGGVTAPTVGGGGGRGRSPKNPANDELRDLERLNAALKSAQDEYAILSKYSGDVSKLTAAEKELTLVKMQQASATDATGRAYTAQEKAAQASKVAVLEKLVAQEKDNEAAREANKLIAKAIEDTKSWVDSTDVRIANLVEENETHGKAKKAIEAVTLARMKDALASGETVKVGDKLLNVTQEMINKQEELLRQMQIREGNKWSDSLKEEVRQYGEKARLAEEEISMMGMSNLERQKVIALRKVELYVMQRQAELQALLNSKKISPKDFETKLGELDKGKIAMQSSAIQQVLRDDFAKTADTINKDLTGALVSWVESGGSLAKKLANVLKSTFNRMVLTPTVNLIMQPIANMVNGLMNVILNTVTGGLLGGSGGGGAAGLISNGSTLNSAYGLFSGNMATNASVGAGNMYYNAANLLGYGAGASGAGAGTLAFANAIGAAGGDSMGAFIAANGSWTGGSAPGAMATGLGVVAIPLIVGALAERNMRDRVGGAAYATSNWRNDAYVTTRGTDYDPTNGVMPSHDALASAALAAGMSESDLARFGTTNDRALYHWVQSAASSSNSESGYNAGTNISALLEGDYASNFYSGQGYADPQSMGWWNRKGYDLASVDPKIIDASRKLSVSIVDTLTASARAIGQDSNFKVTTGWANRGKGDLWGAAEIERDGKVVASLERSDFKDTEHYMRAVFSTTLDAFKSLDLPAWASEMVQSTQDKINALDGDKVGTEAAALYQQASQEIVKTMNTIKMLIDVFPDFSDQTQDTVHALTEVMGGLDNLTSAYSNYIQNFYSEDERRALARKQVESQFEAIGQKMPATRDEFRRMVEALDLSTDEGRKAFAALMGISQAFADLTANSDSAMRAVFDGAQNLAGVIREGLLGNLSSENVGEQMADIVVGGIYNAIAGGFADQITQIVMQGVINPVIQAAVTGASITGAVSQATIDKMVADAVAVAEALGTVLNDPAFRQAMATIEQTMLNLAPRITAPQPYYQTYDHRRQQAEQAAQEAARRAEEQQREAQRAAEEAARKAEQIATERLGLMKQLLQLEGNQNALRQIELNGLDESNRALQERIWALQDAAEAEAKHTEALKEAQEFLGNFSRTIDEFIFNTKMADTLDGRESYSMAAAKFGAQMTLARGGDRESMGSITGYASTLIDSIRKESSSTEEMQLRVARVLGQLGELPRMLTAEELIVQAIEDMRNTLSGVLVSQFDSLDTTMDGLLSVDELRASGLATNTQISALMARVDVNGDGFISKAEAIRAQAELTKLGVSNVNSSVGGVTTAVNGGTTSAASWSNTINTTTRGGLYDVNGSVGITNGQLTYNGLSAADRIYQMAMSTLYIRTLIENAQRDASPVYVAISNSSNPVTVRSEYRGGAFSSFAKGGVFANEVVNHPTFFTTGQMGEAGPEAIMPLGRDGSGRLGVKLIGGSGRGDSGEVAALLRAIHSELTSHDRNRRAEAQATVRNLSEIRAEAGKTRRIHDDWDANGTPVPRGQVQVKESA